MKYLNNIIKHPLYIVIGLTMALDGVFFMLHSNYFQYPPFLKAFENDHVVGFVFFLAGLALFLSKVFPEYSNVKLDGIIIAACAGLMAMLSVVELLHYIVLKVYMPFIPNMAITAILVTMASRDGGGNA